MIEHRQGVSERDGSLGQCAIDRVQVSWLLGVPTSRTRPAIAAALGPRAACPSSGWKVRPVSLDRNLREHRVDAVLAAPERA
jgi:hypothetical protein